MTLVYMEKVSAVGFPVQKTPVDPVNMHGATWLQLYVPKHSTGREKGVGEKTAGVKVFLLNKCSSNDLLVFTKNRFQGIGAESTEAISGCLQKLFSFLRTNL